MAFLLQQRVNIGFFLALAAFTTISFLSYQNAHLLINNTKNVAHTHEVIETLEIALSQMRDLETGQRGFVITGKDEYLAPFNNALYSIEDTLKKLQSLIIDNFEQQKKFLLLQKIKSQRLAELQKVVQLRRSGGLALAQSRIFTGAGMKLMNEFRDTISEMKSLELNLLKTRDEAASNSTQTTLLIIILGSCIASAVLLGAIILVNIAQRARFLASKKLEEQNKIRSGLIQLNSRVAGELSLAALANNTIETLASFVEAQVGALYVANENNLTWAGGYSYLRQPMESSSHTRFTLGEGIVGQAAAQKKMILVSDIPNDYLKISSGLGETSPKFIYALPFTQNDMVKGVIELGLLSPLDNSRLEFLNLSLDIIGIAFNSAQIRLQVAELLEKTQLQTEELQSQQEELRATNEELNEKTNQLQTQQEELRQSNEELEEQRTTLEEQKEELESINREIEVARRDIQQKADALEISGKYKSEFLANMSHELRTPLNSILLLSKALTEDAEEALSGRQDEACRAIYSSGCDLLNLINDILDLAKVEAGKLEIHFEETDVAEIARGIKNQFRPLMEAKKLEFNVSVSESCPQKIMTDRFRLDQILKNFVSNALKFTASGSVNISFKSAENASLLISVEDTGIGIPSAKRNRIFEAFEQADSTLNRKYGGTGLGLTIARELSRLLGGEIAMKSEEGKGSQFTITLPLTQNKLEGFPRTYGKALSKTQRKAHQDDREKITKEHRSILIIEQDPNLAKTLFNLCSTRGFLCLLAENGEAALEDATEYMPDAIILDSRLPGKEGMTVIDRLKSNFTTRNIPIHVISNQDMNDNLGKTNLEDALDRIENELSIKDKKVLIVEDDKIERDAIQKLIEKGKNKVKTVSSGAEAIELLKSESFDCMVLDLKLSDMSGLEVLEKIQKEQNLHHTPVIVYTGKDLCSSELQKLRELSESVIIKGVRSEERLFDEVSLFLHRIVKLLPKGKQEPFERVHPREQIFQGKKVLIVDDDARNVFALKTVLHQQGFEIFTAQTGKQALEQLELHSDMDLVLMDIMMPEMDGFEASKIIRSQKKFESLPIIALTAKAMKGDREKCLDSGANDYLSKPINMDSLLSLMRVWLSRK